MQQLVKRKVSGGGEKEMEQDEKRVKLDMKAAGDVVWHQILQGCPKHIRCKRDGPSFLFENGGLRDSNSGNGGGSSSADGPQAMAFAFASKHKYSLVVATNFVYYNKEKKKPIPANKYGIFQDKQAFLQHLYTLIKGGEGQLAQQTYFPLYFELLRGPVKFYADLDASGTALCNLNQEPLEEARVIEDFTKAYQQVRRLYLNDTEQETLYWSGASRDNKVSLHVVAHSVQHYWPNNHQALYSFIQAQFIPYLEKNAGQYPNLFFRAAPNAPPTCVVDKKVYTMNRVMRAQFCSKADCDPPRPLYPYFPALPVQPTQQETFCAWTHDERDFLQKCMPYMITLEPHEVLQKTSYVNRDCDALLQHYYQQPDLYPMVLCHKMLRMNNLLGTEALRTTGIQFKSGSPFTAANWFNLPSCDVFRTNVQKRLPYAVHMGDMTVPAPTTTTGKGKNKGKEARFYKEVVFDLDVTDCTRFCGCDDKLCPVCWTQMQGAYQLLHHYLTRMQAYKPEHLLWVFSGSKGLHCLVNDKRALQMTTPEREILFMYLHSCTQSETTLWEYIKTLQRHDQPFLTELDQFFVRNMLEQHDLLARDDFQQFCFTLLERQFRPMLPKLRLEWEKPGTTSTEKWEKLLELQTCFHKGVSASRFIIFKLFFPVIDKKPFTIQVHLIKTPFSVHAKTEQVALPLQRHRLLRAFPSQAQQIGFISLTDLPHGEPLQWDDLEKQVLFEEGRLLLDAWVKQYK